jgi:F-type H+-transporting ATPase subunit a
VSEKPKKRVWARWVVLAAILLGLFLFFQFDVFGVKIGLGITPIMPHVYLPGEKLTEEPWLGVFYPTNTFIGMIIADIVVFAIAFGVARGVRNGKMVLGGIPGAVEALLEMLYGITEGTAGKWTKQIFPWFATITLLVLAANWSGLVPGNETIGIIHEYDGHGYALKHIGPITTIWD